MALIVTWPAVRSTSASVMSPPCSAAYEPYSFAIAFVSRAGHSSSPCAAELKATPPSARHGSIASMVIGIHEPCLKRRSVRIPRSRWSVSANRCTSSSGRVASSANALASQLSSRPPPPTVRSTCSALTAKSDAPGSASTTGRHCATPSSSTRSASGLTAIDAGMNSASTNSSSGGVSASASVSITASRGMRSVAVRKALAVSIYWVDGTVPRRRARSIRRLESHGGAARRNPISVQFGLHVMVFLHCELQRGCEPLDNSEFTRNRRPPAPEH